MGSMRDDSGVDNTDSGHGAAGPARNVADAPRVADLLAAARAAGVAPLDAELLLAALTGQPRSRLLAFAEQPLDPMTALLYEACVARRAAGEPLAYITGVKEFWSLPLTVSPAVLVPRPETELLVERCLAMLDAPPHRVADLGTGSGAIALALSRERPRWQIVATDASPEALEVAAANVQRLGAHNVVLRAGSWCAPLAGERYHAIVSNPPYVEDGHPGLAELAFEPRAALVAPDDGFADLLAIATGARAHLLPGGHLLLEHGAGQAARLARELDALGYATVACHQDLAGLDRVTTAVWP